MLRILGESTRLCDGISRREWLRIGGLALGGLSLPELLRAQAAASESQTIAKAKRVIVCFFTGGPPQHETFDPKPHAPEAIRGTFKPISTATSGLQICELLPRVARHTEKMAILRAVVTLDNAHSSSGYQVLTGVPHAPMNVENATAKAPNFQPHMGAILRALRSTPGQLPAAITLPDQIANVGEIVWPGQTGGYLGKIHDPWLLKCDPSSEKQSAPDLALPEEIPAVRFRDRRSLLAELDRQFSRGDRNPTTTLYDRYLEQALDLVSGARAREAFDLDRESPHLRDRYGRSRFGQSVLLARRLVESGVSLVQVNWTRIEGKPNHGGWDTHEKHLSCCQEFLLPMADMAFSTLLEDLEQRGLLDETLVVWLGEFGRTPKINGRGGRDHWGRVFSIALAGAGIRGGTVYGASDATGAEAADGRVEPKDILATIYHLLGYPSHTMVHDTLGRPLPISRGKVIEGILS